MLIRELARDEIPTVWTIDRSEVIDGIYYLRDGQLVLEAEHYDVRGWSPGMADESTPILLDCFDRGGTVWGAFDGDQLAGMAVLESKFIGQAWDQLQLVFLHVSSPYRKQGLGRALFDTAVGRARALGARRLYVSATPSENTVHFYQHLGCVVTREVDPELFELEPEDIHFEYAIPMSHDAYAGFAERYDRFFGAFDAHDAEEVAFFRELFAANGVQCVLDCACGTGRHLHLFHCLGCQVTGTDISASMLARAKLNLAACGLEAHLHQADYRELPQFFEQRFDAVVCLSSSLLHMPNEAEAIRALGSMGGVLRQGGVLVLTQGTTDRQWREKPRFILALDEPDLTRLFAIDYLEAGARYHILDVVREGDGGELQTWSVEYPQVYLRDDQERLLRAAGFGEIEFYGSYGFEPYDKDASQRLIAVAQAS